MSNVTAPRLVSTTLAGPGTEAVLGDALRSVAPIVDRCLIVWTGPSDQKIEIERAALAATEKACVVAWPWRADFGAARQAALDLATETGAAWCLWVDTDEWIDPRGEDVRATVLGAAAAAIMMPDAHGTYYQPRAIRLPCAARWSGRTHEAIALSGPCFARACFGERPKTPDQIRAKRGRDLAILLDVTREAPDEPRWWYYLGDTLAGLGRHEEAVAAFRRRADLRGWDEEAAWACYRAAEILLFDLGRHEDAIDVCASGLARHPGVAELPWLAGIAAQRLGRHDHAVYWARIARIHGERAAGSVRALDRRTLFRSPKGLREGPADIERFSLRVLGDAAGACAAEAEIAAWTVAPGPERSMNDAREKSLEGSEPGRPRVDAAWPVHLTVTSTARNAAAFAGKCVRSVREQTFRAHAHVYVGVDEATREAARAEAGGLGAGAIIVPPAEPGLPVLANLLPLWRSLPDEEVIVWLDGDDWLATDQALGIVAAAHARGAWATYGQFIWGNGSMGFAAQVGPDPRSEAWRATHLRSFRAALAKRIRDEDLREPDGRYAGLVADQRVMLAVLEMAGERARFVPEVLMVYNHAHAFAATASPEEIVREHAELARVRSFRRYERLDRLV